jgi:2-phosphoglycerate kinase
MPTMVQVHDLDDQQFFSKGLLAHQLTNRGLIVDSMKAYSLALKVEERLLKSGIGEISALELVEVITEELRNEFDPKIANRYNLVSKLPLEGKSLVIVMIGTVGVGKGTLANNLATLFRISRILGTDVVHSLMKDLLSPKLVPELQASPFEAYKDLRSIYSSIYDPLLIGFNEVSKIVDAGLRSIIYRSEREKISTIIRGELFALKEIGPWLLDQPEVFPFMITLSDETLHKERLLKDEQVSNQKLTEDSFDAIRKIQNYLLEGSEKMGIQIIDNHSSEETIETILDVIVSKMKPKLEKKEL